MSNEYHFHSTIADHNRYKFLDKFYDKLDKLLEETIKEAQKELNAQESDLKPIETKVRCFGAGQLCRRFLNLDQDDAFKIPVVRKRKRRVSAYNGHIALSTMNKPGKFDEDGKKDAGAAWEDLQKDPVYLEKCQKLADLKNAEIESSNVDLGEGVYMEKYKKTMDEIKYRFDVLRIRYNTHVVLLTATDKPCTSLFSPVLLTNTSKYFLLSFDSV